jgi:hypothetical protein
LKRCCAPSSTPKSTAVTDRIHCYFNRQGSDANLDVFGDTSAVPRLACETGTLMQNCCFVPSSTPKLIIQGFWQALANNLNLNKCVIPLVMCICDTCHYELAGLQT